MAGTLIPMPTTTSPRNDTSGVNIFKEVDPIAAQTALLAGGTDFALDCGRKTDVLSYDQFIRVSNAMRRPWWKLTSCSGADMEEERWRQLNRASGCPRRRETAVVLTPVQINPFLQLCYNRWRSRHNHVSHLKDADVRLTIVQRGRFLTSGRGLLVGDDGDEQSLWYEEGPPCSRVEEEMRRMLDYYVNDFGCIGLHARHADVDRCSGDSWRWMQVTQPPVHRGTLALKIWMRRGGTSDCKEKVSDGEGVRLGRVFGMLSAMVENLVKQRGSVILALEARLYLHDVVDTETAR